ncbi:zinc ribbon domain-containing protein [Streptomyces sp. NBC_00656]|uniref:zinc ribbon domain-containing protein n=1 Tax=Streptomyces sp. NBC_00656 TaxID=2903668 RepID=UPI003864F711
MRPPTTITELRFQRCARCRTVVFRTRLLCPACSSTDLRWKSRRVVPDGLRSGLLEAAFDVVVGPSLDGLSSADDTAAVARLSPSVKQVTCRDRGQDLSGGIILTIVR